jgi:hypothetical protein
VNVTLTYVIIQYIFGSYNVNPTLS